MECAIDIDGNYVHHSVAKESTLYRCPECLERVLIRKKSNACFYHNPIKERTPLERTCPEYHENSSYKKIYDEIDIMYIRNGGIPVYLCNYGNHFELRAYFPEISKEGFEKLEQSQAKIIVNSNAYSKIDRKEYNFDNLIFYPVNTIERWIEVRCEPSISKYDTEIKRKWLWGIRGVDIEKDIYHSNKDGGYRVALKANIIVGKRYRIMFDRYPPKIKGVNFKKKGETSLREKDITKIIGIYEMTIEIFTEEARGFIEGKGYKLVEQPNKLVSLWPPGVFKGNEITFNEAKVFFLYIDNSQKEKVYFSSHKKSKEIYINKKNSIVPLQLNENSLIVTSNEQTFNFEIKYNILYKDYLVEKKELKQQIRIKDSSDTEIKFNIEKLTLPKDRKLYIDSNLPFCATVSNKNYVIYSSSRYFENVDYLLDLKINSRAFGIKNYIYERKSTKISKIKKFNWEEEYLKLYRCNEPYIKASNRHFELLHLLSKNIDKKNIYLYRLLETWIKTNCMPVSAMKYVDEIFEFLGGI